MFAGIALLVAAGLVAAAIACQLAGVRLATPLKAGIGGTVALLVAVALAAAPTRLPVAVEVAAPAPTTPPGDPLSDAEKNGLAWLHRNTVEIFIDRPGFGMRRMVLPMEDVVKAPKSSSKKDSPDKDPRPADPTPIPSAEKPGQPPKETHFSVEDALAKHGLARFPSEDKKEQWKVTKVQLVGLVKHKEPVVYLTDKMPDMKEVKDVATRELDTFEKAALETLRGGENLKAERKGKELRAMGPIYAGQRCVACHEQKGHMLGAFSFQLERVPVEAEKKRPDGERIP